MAEIDPVTLTQEDFQHALEEQEGYSDVTSEELLEVYHAAVRHARIRQTEQILVERVMCREVVTVTEQTAILDAAELLLEHHISGMPVVDGAKRVVGVVAIADFMAAIGVPCHHPAHTVWDTLDAMFLHRPKMQGFKGVIADIMTHPVVTVTPQTTLDVAVGIMAKQRIKRLVVVDEAERLCGVVTKSDIVHVFIDQARRL